MPQTSECLVSADKPMSFLYAHCEYATFPYRSLVGLNQHGSRQRINHSSRFVVLHINDRIVASEGEEGGEDSRQGRSRVIDQRGLLSQPRFLTRHTFTLGSLNQSRKLSAPPCRGTHKHCHLCLQGTLGRPPCPTFLSSARCP